MQLKEPKQLTNATPGYFRQLYYTNFKIIQMPDYHRKLNPFMLLHSRSFQSGRLILINTANHEEILLNHSIDSIVEGSMQIVKVRGKNATINNFFEKRK